MYKLANITTKKQAESDTEIWNVYFATKKKRSNPLVLPGETGDTWDTTGDTRLGQQF